MIISTDSNKRDNSLSDFLALIIFWALLICSIYYLFGEGNCNPLQYSCLENYMNRGAWQATVHGVSKSRTWLRRLSYATDSLSTFKNCSSSFLKSRFIDLLEKNQKGNSGPEFPKGNNQLGAIYHITTGVNHLFTLIMSTGLVSGFGLPSQVASGYSARQDHYPEWGSLSALPTPFLEGQKDIPVFHSFI